MHQYSIKNLPTKNYENHHIHHNSLLSNFLLTWGKLILQAGKQKYIMITTAAKL